MFFLRVHFISIFTLVFLLGARTNHGAGLPDTELLEHARRIDRHLRDLGYQNVGILPFRSQSLQDGEHLEPGGIGYRLSRWLTNALIMAQPDSPKALSILNHPVEDAASQLANPSYATSTGRQQLFSIDYSPAWGNQRLRADAFITGRILLDYPMQMRVELFSATAPESPIHLFTCSIVPSLGLLADSGFPAAVSEKHRRNCELSAEPESPEQWSTELQTRDEVSANELTYSISSKLDFEVVIDSRNTGFYPLRENVFILAREPETRETVALRVRNRSDSNLGLVVAVNGRNTLGDQSYEGVEHWASYLHWILLPGETYTIQGFYTSPEQLQEFEVISDEHPAFDQLASENNAGRIHLLLLEQSRQPSAAPPTSDYLALKGPRPMDVSTTSLHELKRSLVRDRLLPNQSLRKGLITGGRTAEADLQQMTLNQPTLHSAIEIRYR